MLELEVPLEEKWNLEGKFDILVTEICLLNLRS
jgi:hypothetical protein